MKKKIVVSIIAVCAALAGAAWAIAKLVKRGGKKMSEDLDYDENFLAEDDYAGDDLADLAGPDVEAEVEVEENIPVLDDIPSVDDQEEETL